MHPFKDNRVVRDTGGLYPILQSPMSWIARSSLVSAVSAAGATGIMETSSGFPIVQQEYDAIRARTDRPFAVNVAIKFIKDRPEVEKAVLDWALDGRSRFVTTGYGDPARYIRRIKDAGMTTYHLTDSLDEAMRAEDAGVDGVVLGGAEKGGGNSPDGLHTFALLQKARRRLSIPIVATGGIVDGYGMAAAFALGAEGVWMGTRFIASKECPWHGNYKQAIVDAEQVIAIDMGLPIIPTMRAVRTPFAEAVAKGEAGHKKNPYAGDTMKLFYEGDTSQALVGAGESAVLIDEVKSAGDIVRDTASEFWEAVDRLAGLRPA